MLLFALPVTKQLMRNHRSIVSVRIVPSTISGPWTLTQDTSSLGNTQVANASRGPEQLAWVPDENHLQLRIENRIVRNRLSIEPQERDGEIQMVDVVILCIHKYIRHSNSNVGL